MAKKILTDEQVEQEIENLKKSEDVKLARKYERMQYKKRQALYHLRDLEKRGKRLRAAGITLELLDREDFDLNDVES